MARMVERSVRQGVIALLIASALWGLTFPLVSALNAVARECRFSALGASSQSFNLAQEWQSAGCYLALRFSLAFLLLGCVSLSTLRSMSAADWMKGAATGAAFTLGGLLQTIGLATISSSRSAFLTSLYVVFTPAISILLGWERANKMLACAVLLAVVGAAVITGMLEINSAKGPTVEEKGGNQTHILEQHSARENSHSLASSGWGDLLTVLSAVVFSVQILMVDHFAREMQPTKLTAGMFLGTTLCGALALIPLPGQTLAQAFVWTSYLTNPVYLSITLTICLVCTLGPFHLMNKHQAKVGPTQAAVIYSLEPLFAAAAGTVLPGLLQMAFGGTYPQERITWSLIAGGALLLLANCVAANAMQDSQASHTRLQKK